MLGEQGNLAEARAFFRDSLAIAERLASAEPSNAQWQWDVVASHWLLARYGDDPAGRWAFIVAEIRRLKDENRLRPDRARLLSVAEEQLAKFKKPQPRRSETDIGDLYRCFEIECYLTYPGRRVAICPHMPVTHSDHMTPKWAPFRIGGRGSRSQPRTSRLSALDDVAPGR